MTPKEYCKAFCEGYFYAELGEELTTGKVTDKELDLAKETAQKYIEQQIAYSNFDAKQKIKDNFEEWAETVMQGFWKKVCVIVAGGGSLMIRQPTNNRNSVASSLIGSPLGQRLRCRYKNSGRAIASPATSFSSEKGRLG